MKKTVWATGLFAALVAISAWSLPPGQHRVRPDADSFRGIVSEAAENIQATGASQGLAGLKPDMELVERGIFECTYHDNETTSTNKVLIRGTDSCGFLDASEDYGPKRKRVASYVNSHLPGVFQPEKTNCFAVQSRVEDKGRNKKISEYIEQMDQLPLSQDERFQFQGERLQSAIKVEKFIQQELHGDTHYRKALHNEQPCDMLLVTENEAGQSNAGVRSCAKSCLNGLGMLARWAGGRLKEGVGWTWTGMNKIGVPVAGAYAVNWVTTSTSWDAITGQILNVLYGAWTTEVHRTSVGTSMTVGDYAMSAVVFLVLYKYRNSRGN